MKFELEGLNELIRSLEGTANDVDSTKKEALLEGAKVLQDESQKLARRRTGNLIAHIEISDVTNDEVFVYVDNQGKAYYGHMLENGTSKMAARPFMGPAFNRSRIKINQAMAKRIRSKLRWT